MEIETAFVRPGGSQPSKLDDLLAQIIVLVRQEEMERCAKIVDDRAAKWNDAAKADAHGNCAESLADECEDIAAEIRRAPTQHAR